VPVRPAVLPCRTPVRRVALPALSAALAAVLLSGCAAGQDDAGASTGTTVTSPSPSSPAASVAPSAVPPAAPSPSVRTIQVAYAGGAVTGTSGREQVRLGEPVVLRISSDVADQVHVHGYDLEQAVPAGGTVEIPVDATIPGVFEVELHDTGKLLFQLRVA